MAKTQPIVRFLNGGLDLDSHPALVAKSDFIQALNITRDQINGSNDMIVSNIKGNRKVAYNLPMGTNRCIGSFPDQLRNAIYYLVYNSNDHHSVLYYDNAARTITKILESVTDTGGIDILRLNFYSKISHINVLHRDEGDLMFWTDGQVQPRKINIQRLIAGTYGTVEEDFINAAKKPPQVVTTVAYGNDATKTTNSLRKALYKAKYRWVYDDFEKSTWSQISDVPLPVNADDPDVAKDPTQNNFISMQVTTGNKDVTAIEIAVQSNIENLWSDFFLATSLVKTDLGIADNAAYQFNFYNDGVYPAIDVTESNLLFDWLPLLAKSQTFANGNTLVYGAITEQYDPIPLDVDISVVNIKNTGEDLGPPALGYSDGGSGGSNWTFTVSGDVPTGTFYKIVMNISGLGIIIMTTYTSIGGDTVVDVAGNLYNNTSPTYQASYGGTNSFILNTPSGSSIVQVQVIPGSGGGITTINSPTTWNWNSKYQLGLVYFDAWGRTNGVMYNADFDLVTPNLSTTGGVPETPVVTSSINHIPPTWAVKYMWARTNNLTYQNFLYYLTCDLQSDTDYYYFGLQNIEYFFDLNTTFIYPTLVVEPNDRIKILVNAGGGTYTSSIYNDDYEILGTEERVITGGGPTELGVFVKVRKPTTPPSPAYGQNIIVMVYTPAKNTSAASNTVFYEFGDTYDIYNLYTLAYTAGAGVFTSGEIITGGTSGATGTIVVDTSGVSMTANDVTGTFVVGEIITGGTSGATATINVISSARYHAGLDQDQTNIQPATFTFTGGDIYYRTRTMYYDITVATGPQKANVSIMDANYSDFFLSAVNENGRAEIIDVNAKQQYLPAVVRFGQSYIINTGINGLNRFYFENFDEYNGDYGDILKLDTYASYMKVGQRLRIGNVPVLLQIVKNADGTDNLTVSDQLLNRIVYYDGDFGVGNTPESWARRNFAVYFTDSIRGVVVRLSQDGNIPISILYKVNSWATEKLPLRGGNSKIYGNFNAIVNNYEFAMEAVGSDPAFTMVFNENRNTFEGERSYHPDWMCNLGTLQVTFKDGELWTHDSPTLWNNFYGTQHSSSITPNFNDEPLIKKIFNATGYQSLKTWQSPVKGDILTSVYNSQTGLQQESLIMEMDYDFAENPFRYAAFNRDMNSMTDEQLALWEGDFLNGTYILVKYQYSGADFVTLLAPYVTYLIQQRNF